MANKTVNSPATIADVNKIVKSSEKVLRAEILRVEERLERVEDKLSTKIEGVEDKLSAKIEGVEDKLSAKIDKVLTAVSNFAGRVENLETENEIGTDQIHELGETTKDHAKRIAKLESPN